MRTCQMICITVLFVLQGCSQVSNLGGTSQTPTSEGNSAFDSSDIRILGLHYEAHKERLLKVFQLDKSAESFAILDDYKDAFETQTITSTFLNSAMKVYAKACEEVSLSVISEDMSFSDIFFTLTGMPAGEDEMELKAELDNMLSGESQDYRTFVYCFASATSLFGLSPLTDL